MRSRKSQCYGSISVWIDSQYCKKRESNSDLLFVSILDVSQQLQNFIYELMHDNDK
jgi:hypothetical protein